VPWPFSSAGKILGPRLRGQDQLVYCLEDIKRAAELGIRSVLLADEGALWVASEMRLTGELPQDMQFKSASCKALPTLPLSVSWSASEPSTFNIPTDLTSPKSPPSARPSTSLWTSM